MSDKSKEELAEEIKASIKEYRMKDQHERYDDWQKRYRIGDVFETDMVVFGQLLVDYFREDINREMSFNEKLAMMNDILSTYSSLQNYILLPGMDEEQCATAKELCVRLATQSMVVWLRLIG